MEPTSDSEQIIFGERTLDDEPPLVALNESKNRERHLDTSGVMKETPKSLHAIPRKL